MNSISSLHLLCFFFPPSISLCVCFQCFSTPQPYRLPVSFQSISFGLSFATGVTVCFLPLLSQTDWVNRASPALCSLLNHHSAFPFATPPTSHRGPNNNPPKKFWNICPHRSDFWCPYSLMVLLQARRLSCSADHLLLDWGCFSSEQLPEAGSQPRVLSSWRLCTGPRSTKNIPFSYCEKNTQYLVQIQ